MELLDQFVKKLENNKDQVSVHVYGDSMIDEDYEVKVNRISPESPNVNILRCEHFVPFRKYPGGAANVCYLLKNFKANSRLFTYLDEEAAAYLQEHLPNLVHAVLPEGHFIPRKKRFYEKSSSQFTQRIDIEVPNYGLDIVRLDELNRIVSIPRTVDIETPDVIIFSDYNKGFFNGNFSLDSFEKNPIKIVDPKAAPLERWIGCDVFKPNAREATELTGLTNWQAQCDDLQERLKCKCVIITQEGNGIVGKIWNSYYEYRPHLHVKPVDIVGAGDCFVAVLALALAHKFTPVEAAKIAFHGGIFYVQQKHRGMFGPWSFRMGGKILNDIDILKERNYKLAFTNGCFDLFHAGHLKSLQAARACADRLVVAVNSDRSVRELKGDNRPIMPLSERMELLAALECVDYVISFDEATPLQLIEEIKPDVLIKGSDWQGKGIVGEELVKEVCYVPLLEEHSTTRIIEKIKKS